MFVHLIKRTKFLVDVRLFNKRTNTNELLAEQFTNCSMNVWFVCSSTDAEIGRLRALYQQQLQPPPPSNHRRTTSKDKLDAQFANLSLKKDSGSTSDVSGTLQI
ncbi:hypothetical protein Hanom_Chr00s002877g01706581 [Helianthus anomalus]